MKPINIIGAGMAGSILAKLFKREGIEYRLFDSERKGAASRISENLIGESWYKDEQEVVREAVAILHTIVPVRRFASGGHSFLHVYTKDLLETDYFKADCMPTGTGVVATVNAGQDDAESQVFEGFTVVCAGMWTQWLTPTPMTYTVGHGLLIKEPEPIVEKIKLYKPFKFEKLINRNPGEVWYSNSMEVQDKTYQRKQEKYFEEIYDGARKFSTLNWGDAEYQTGYRPCTHSHSNRMIRNGIVVTGGRTQGMIRYPIQCLDVVRFIKDQERFL